jgi:DNA adenine methylase
MTAVSKEFGINEKQIKTFLKKQREKNRSTGMITDIPYPFLKWAGGKRQLLSQMNPYIPNSFDRYFEPFAGAGAVFFFLLPEIGFLWDINPELINTYQVIKEDVEPLILSLKQHKNEREYFLQTRNADRDLTFNRWSPIQKASRTIFLNKCCFNGLYRVNSKGFFNVPFGRYENPNFCDEKNLRAVSWALQNIEIQLGSYSEVLNIARSGDFIYFDPPYQPLSKTSSFTGYTKDNFREEDQQQLRNIYKQLDQRGCKVMLSNSFNSFIEDLYREYKRIPINAKRAINCDASRRGQIQELLVINY